MPLYPSFAIARKRTVFALRAEFSSLSFPKEKGTKKKENLRACALKNPPDCTDLLCSIKNGMLIVAARFDFALPMLCQHNKCKAKSNSDHRNSYFAGTLAAGATIGRPPSLHQHNAERTRAFPSRGRWRRQATDEVRPRQGAGEGAKTSFADAISIAPSHSPKAI